MQGETNFNVFGKHDLRTGYVPLSLSLLFHVISSKETKGKEEERSFYVLCKVFLPQKQRERKAIGGEIS